MCDGYTLPASGLIKSTAVVIEVFPKHIRFCSSWSLISRKLSYHKTRQSAVNESFQAIFAFTQRVVQSGDEFGHKRNHESLKKNRYGSQYKSAGGVWRCMKVYEETFKNHSFHSRAFNLSKASVSSNKTIDKSWNKWSTSKLWKFITASVIQIFFKWAYKITGNPLKQISKWWDKLTYVNDNRDFGDAFENVVPDSLTKIK